MTLFNLLNIYILKFILCDSDNCSHFDFTKTIWNKWLNFISIHRLKIFDFNSNSYCLIVWVKSFLIESLRLSWLSEWKLWATQLYISTMKIISDKLKTYEDATTKSATIKNRKTVFAILIKKKIKSMIVRRIKYENFPLIQFDKWKINKRIQIKNMSAKCNFTIIITLHERWHQIIMIKCKYFSSI